MLTDGRERARGLTTAVSSLRAARVSRNLTLEKVAHGLNCLVEDGRSGVTTSMLSGWERGVHTTSFRFRELLCDFYDEPADVLFGDQDGVLTSNAEAPILLAGYPDLAEGLLSVVRSAEQYLAVTGSRSRDIPYLEEIERALAERPGLVHYRILFGPPRHQLLRDHLSRLLEMRDPEARPHGVKTLHIGIVDDIQEVPERFLCASESAAVVPIPSLTSAEEFDSGIRFGPEVAGRLIEHTRQCYAAARKVETIQAVLDLDVPSRPGG